jgi:hypothetical protein
MSRRNTSPVRLWFIAALMGFNGLLLVGAAQGGAMLRSAAAGQLTFQDDAPASAAVPGTEALVPAHVRHLSHALLRTSASALLPQAASIVAPVFAGELPVCENVLALGNAPRPTGPSRAPPAA